MRGGSWSGSASRLAAGTSGPAGPTCQSSGAEQGAWRAASATTTRSRCSPRSPASSSAPSISFGPARSVESSLSRLAVPSRGAQPSVARGAVKDSGSRITGGEVEGKDGEHDGATTNVEPNPARRLGAAHRGPARTICQPTELSGCSSESVTWSSRAGRWATSFGSRQKPAQASAMVGERPGRPKRWDGPVGADVNLRALHLKTSLQRFEGCYTPRG